MPTIKARVEERGDLVIVETEIGQKAVIPRDKLCELAARFNIEYINIDIKCEGATGGERFLEVE